MNGFDIAVVVLTIVLVTFGMLKGIVRILVALLALMIAFTVASQLHQPVADALVDSPEGPSGAVRLVAYLLIFLAVMLIGGVIAWLLTRIVKAAMLGWADRLAGAALGFVMAALTTALLILPVVAYTPKGETLLRDSALVPYVAVVTDMVNRLAPEDMARRYRERMKELRRRWRGDDIVWLRHAMTDRA